MRQHTKRELALPNVAKSGGRFDCSFFKKEEGAIEHSAEITLDTTQPPTLSRQRYKTGMDIPRQGRKGAAQAPLQ